MGDPLGTSCEGQRHKDQRGQCEQAQDAEDQEPFASTITAAGFLTIGKGGEILEIRCIRHNRTRV